MVLAIEKYPSLVLPSIVLMLQQIIIQFPLYYLSRGCLQEVKKQEKISNF